MNLSANAALMIPGQSAQLTWSSTGTACTASGGWTGAKAASGAEVVGPIAQTTSFSISCTNAGSTAAVASATVAVEATSTTPAATATRVTSNSAHTVLDYNTVNLGIRDILWDPQHSLFYAVTRADSAVSPNSLVSINPTTSAMQVQALGAEPWCVAVSGDGTYLYVGFSTGGTVKRFLTNGLAPDITVTVGNTDSRVAQVAPSPLAPRTFAARVTNMGTVLRPESPGVVIADDATLRPNSVHGLVSSPSNFGVINVSDMHWSTDATRIYGAIGDAPGGIAEFAVSAQGVAVDRYHAWPVYGAFELHGDKLFTTGGTVFSFTGPIDQLGEFAYGFGNVVYSEARGKTFNPGAHQTGVLLDGTTVYVHDPDHYTLIDSIDFVGAAEFDLARLMVWGTDGIALINDNTLLIAHGSFAAAGGSAPAPATAMTVVSNSTLAAGASGLNYRVLDFGVLDVAANPCGELYAATAGGSAARPNSVVQVNVADASIVRSAYAGSEPYTLAASDDCSTIYAGRYSSNSVARIRLADMTLTDELPTGSAPIGLMRARTVSVAPGQAQTVAITHGDMGQTLCGGSTGTTRIFDGATPRPVPYGNNSDIGVKTAIWGGNATTMYGENWFNIFAFTGVDANGPNNPTVIMPYRVGTSVYDLGRDLYFDPARNRLYNSFGNIYDVASGTERGPLVPDENPSIWDACGTPGQTLTTDRTTGKIFWVSQATGTHRISVTTYAPDTLVKIGTMVIGTPGSAELPLRVVRPTSNSLAIVTSDSHLVLVQGALLEP